MAAKSPPLCFVLTLLSLLSITFFYLHSISPSSSPNPKSSTLSIAQSSLRVFIAPLPRSLNYGLLDKYWALTSDTRIGSEVDNEIRKSLTGKGSGNPQPFPENPIIKQYSAEYWILGDLLTPDGSKGESYAIRVSDYKQADVIFVPFFATMSAELQLIINKSVFRKRVEENEDYVRQKMVVDLVKKSEAWQRSGGRDHVFVLTDPVSMYHLKDEIAPAILLLVDFGGWQHLDAKTSNGSSDNEMIHHTQVSLLKDVIVPYTHLLPRLDISNDRKRHQLLYFKGAKHRHRGGLVREKLWDILINVPGIIIEEGFPNATGKEQSIKGMRSSEFCLHPAGDTPTSCRLFDAIQSLCIPVIVSDNIELPFEGIVDYSEFSVFVAVSDALRPNWLVNHLKSFSTEQKDQFRRNMAEAQPIFQYDNGYPGGVGPVPSDGAVNHIWRKVHQKIPIIKEAVTREKRKPAGATVPLRCHCI
ncbi:probable arabinosyltransferase ARAD1 [Andrographis paniculata]|uniref:probable arabinosyltransferase ARAD1 n=1 Tax=Andrographis paniculata TaxID=175694 RepID=UPI0021E714C5|nr:probable arabinosyltransferase ARAD1 [Andrographis paniculata]